MCKTILLLVSVLSAIASCHKAQVGETRVIGAESPWPDTSTSHPKHAALTKLLDKYTKEGLPGISLLVNDRYGTWIGAKGKADLSNDIAFAPGTISKIASITKLFIGTLAFRMMEDSVNSGIGYRHLQAPVHSWLKPIIADKVPNGRLVTLAQCLNHETGIPDLIEEDEFYLAVLNHPNKKWKAEELLEFIYGKPAVFDPSDTAIYSNTNTILVTLVLEAASGIPHAALLKKYITQPLSLESTYYQPHDILPNSIAQGYYDLYNNNTIVNVSNLVTGSGNGYGGIYSNLFDLFRFINVLLVNQSFLSGNSMSLMEMYGKADGSNRYGLGVMKKFIERGNDAGIGHSGRDLGYTANLFYFKNKGVVQIFLVNYGTDGDSRLKAVFTRFQEELLDLSLQ